MVSRVRGNDDFDSGLESRVWTNVSADRVNGTVYTNTLPYTIQLAVSYSNNAVAGGSQTGIAVSVDAFTIHSRDATTGGVAGTQRNSVVIDVPSGSTYSVSAVLNATRTEWIELR